MSEPDGYVAETEDAFMEWCELLAGDIALELVSEGFSDGGRGLLRDVFNAGWDAHAAQAQPKPAPPEPEWWWPEKFKNGWSLSLGAAGQQALAEDWLRLKRLAGELPEEGGE